MVGLPGMIDRNKLWEHLETSLSRLLDSLAPKLDGRNLGLLRDFVDHREYGVALEGLHSVLTATSIPISPEQREEMHRLAKTMGISLGN
jgi:hypothetical protein